MADSGSTPTPTDPPTDAHGDVSGCRPTTTSRLVEVRTAVSGEGKSLPFCSSNTTTQREEGDLTEEALHVHDHMHQRQCHERTVEAGGTERSLTHIPSASTSLDRVDEQGQSLLHRGGEDSGNGGVYDSIGTMSKMSGIDPSRHGGGLGIFRIIGEGGGGGEGGDGNEFPPLEGSGSAGSFLRTSSAGGDSVESSGDGGKGGAAAARPFPPLHSSPPPKIKRNSRQVSWGPTDDLGVSGSSAPPSSDRRGFSRDENLRRSPHRRVQSLGDMFLGFASSVRNLVDPNRTLNVGAFGTSVIDEEAGEEDEAGKRGPKLWGIVHRRLDSVILSGGRAKSDFDFDKVQLDENDLAELQAAGVICEDGKVMETPVEIKERGGPALKAFRSIRRKAKRAWLIEEAASVRRKFDVSVKECIVAIVAYLLLSVVAYSFVFEKWPIVDSLYFAVVTFTTIGYGDLEPTTIPGQIFLCFFGLGGVASLGLALGVIGSDIVEARVNAATSAREAAREINKREAITVFDKDEDNESEWTNESETTQLIRSSLKGNETNRSCMSRCFQCFQSVECRKNTCIILPLLVILLGGSIFISTMEGWHVVTGIYYGVVTTCTIGYGDYTPSTSVTRLFSVFFIPVAVAIMGHFLGTFSTYVMEERQKEFKEALSQMDLMPSHLQGMSSKGDGVVTKLDFVEFMLQVMNVVDKELLDELHDKFDQLDELGDGVVTEADLKILATKKLHGARKKLELAEYKQSLLRATAKMNMAEAVDKAL